MESNSQYESIVHLKRATYPVTCDRSNTMSQVRVTIFSAISEIFNFYFRTVVKILTDIALTNNTVRLLFLL